MKAIREMFEVTNKEIVITTLVMAASFPLVYKCIYLMFAMLYAVTGVR